MSVIISIIIPTYNEAANMQRIKLFWLNVLLQSSIELIVVDGNSADNTVDLAKQFATTVVQSKETGRAAQMNEGASIANGAMLYFVHADVTLHPQFFDHIITATQNGIDIGCYRYSFDKSNLLLRFNSYMTKYNTVWTGGGDQTLFINRANFNKLNGFNNNFVLMEDFDFVKRAKKAKLKFAVLPYNITVSARKYKNNSWLRVQLVNAFMVVAWKIGAKPQWMKLKYKKLLKN
jgi:rSAM/selenodomain-associated transferase 2